MIVEGCKIEYSLKKQNRLITPLTATNRIRILLKLLFVAIYKYPTTA